MECAWQVEIDELCRQILSAHWPNVLRYKDVKNVGRNLESVDLICGGFPCQPVSQAGKGKAQDDERWLWPEFFRILCELRPPYVFVENVTSLLGRGMGEVLGDFSQVGYDAEWQTIPAACFGAPHLRARVYLVAYRSEIGWLTPQVFSGITDQEIPQPDQGWRTVHTRRGNGGAIRVFPDTDLLRVDDGFPTELDKARVAALGNAVVPIVAEWIGRLILRHYQLYQRARR